MSAPTADMPEMTLAEISRQLVWLNRRLHGLEVNRRLFEPHTLDRITELEVQLGITPRSSTNPFWEPSFTEEEANEALALWKGSHTLAHIADLLDRSLDATVLWAMRETRDDRLTNTLVSFIARAVDDEFDKSDESDEDGADSTTE